MRSCAREREHNHERGGGAAFWPRARVSSLMSQPETGSGLAILKYLIRDLIRSRFCVCFSISQSDTLYALLDNYICTYLPCTHPGTLYSVHAPRPPAGRLARRQDAGAIGSATAPRRTHRAKKQPNWQPPSLVPSPRCTAPRVRPHLTPPWDLSARTLAPQAREAKSVGQIIGQREQVELVRGAARTAHKASGKLDHDSVCHR